MSEINKEQPTVVINNVEKKTNGIGLTGFILAILGLFLGWIPVLGWIVWILGLIFSAIGMFKKPKGLAIAGLVISLIGVILIVVVFGAAAAAGTEALNDPTFQELIQEAAAEAAASH